MSPCPETPRAVFERRARVPDLAWVMVVLALAVGYIPALVLLEPVLRGLGDVFARTSFETPALLSMILGGALGWFVVPVGALWLIDRWTRARHWRCEVYDDRLAFVRPLDMGNATEVGLDDVRLADCTPHGLVLETTRWVFVHRRGPTRGARLPSTSRRPIRLLLPCPIHEQPRALELLRLGPSPPVASSA